MIIQEFKFVPYSLKLKSPFKNSSFTITERKGFIISIIDENNFVAYGDVSPLPGFSIETYEECEVELNKLYYSIISKTAKNMDFDLISELQSISNLPSLRFGVEQAFISLLIKRKELTSLLNHDKVIAVNGIVPIASKSDMLKSIDDLLINNFKTIKIKVGVGKFEDEIDLLNLVSSRVDDSIKIRIDVNGNWNYQQAEIAVNNLDKDKIELIEQPVKDINEIVMLSDFSPIPIAVDELIKNSNDAKNIIEKSNISTVVLKPSILGGIIETISLIKSAENFRKKIIISSAFESVVGRSAIVLLASLVSNNIAHGLNTASLLENDLATDEYPILNGNIYFKQNNYPPAFNELKI